ncbi:hypothetical protein OROHE_015049 [Orobanche hederae]
MHKPLMFREISGEIAEMKALIEGLNNRTTVLCDDTAICQYAHLISKAAILGIALGALLILTMILVAACRPQNLTPFINGLLDKPDTKLVILNMNMALHVYEDIMRMIENLSEKCINGYVL